MDGRLAIHYAAMNGHSLTVLTLAAYGADVNSCTKNGRTALHGACWNGHTQAALQLTFRPCHQQVPSVEHNLKTVYASMLNSSVCAMVAPG